MRAIETNGVTLAVEDRGEGYPVVLVHGFPETSHSWRQVAPALRDAGFRVITYDLRGCGQSSCPEKVEAYALAEQISDLIGLLDRLGIEGAVVVGHDWGSIIAYAAALRHPGRISHVISLNVPYLGWPAGFPAIDTIRERFSDRLGYVLGFQPPGETESRFDADPRRWLHRMYTGVAGRQDFMTSTELDTYTDALVASGITGLLNLYRNIDRNVADHADIVGEALTQPSLLVTVDKDPVLPAELGEGMSAFAQDLEVVHITECGHWTQQEQPERVVDALLNWMNHRIPG